MTEHKDHALAASGRTAAVKDIGTKLRTSHLALGRMFQSRPVLGGDEGFACEPFRDGLLADRRTTHEVGNPVGEFALASGDLDGGLKGRDVARLGVLRFLHEHPRYTTGVVRVNNSSGVPSGVAVCTVTSMVARLRKKPMERADTTQEEAKRGPDNMTLGERMQLCMDAKSRRLGREYKQKDLLLEVNELLGRDANSEDAVITQQGLSLILNNKRSESNATPAFAVVLECEALWLQYGVGPTSYIESSLRKRR